MINKNGIRIEKQRKKRKPLNLKLPLTVMKKDGKVYLLPQFKQVIELMKNSGYKEEF